LKAFCKKLKAQFLNFNDPYKMVKDVQCEKAVLRVNKTDEK